MANITLLFEVPSEIKKISVLNELKHVQISAVKRLIASKLKVFVYVLCVCNVYVCYVYINTHTCAYILKINILFKYDQLYEYKYIHVNIFKVYTVYVCIYIYT